MRAMLREDLSHDLSHLGGAFDEEHPNAIQTWSPTPDIHRAPPAVRAEQLPEFTADNLLNTNRTVYWALVQYVAAERRRSSGRPSRGRFHDAARYWTLRYRTSGA
jgi:hypothetical protein